MKKINCGIKTVENKTKIDGKVDRDKKESEMKENRFNMKYEPIMRRVTYDAEIRDHLTEELFFIAGVLDMIYLINEGDMWNDRIEEVGFVIMDARNRALELEKCL